MDGLVFSQATQPTVNDDDGPAQSQMPSGNAWGQLKGFTNGTKLLLIDANRDYVLGRHATSDFRFDSAQVSNKHCAIIRLDRDLKSDQKEQKDQVQEQEQEPKEPKVAQEVAQEPPTPSTMPPPSSSDAPAPKKWTERSPSTDKALVLIQDFSSNGTFVNGKLVGKGNRVPLQHKDLISLASKNAHSASPDLFLIYEDLSEKFGSFDGDEELRELTQKYYLTEVVLGTGNFATVKLAFHAQTGEKFAVKIINKQKFIQKPKFHEHLVTEITILKKLNHPGIVRIYDVVDTSKNVYIFLELVSGGELFQLITQKGNLVEKMAKIFFHQILRAVEYLHDNNVIHRDLKPENLLLEKGDYPIVKITDFGLAKIVGDESFVKTLCGTPNYIAPEVLDQTTYNKAVDCWSLGVILYAMLAGALPFSDDDKKTLFSQIKMGNLNFPEEEWKQVSEEAKNLIRGLIQKDPLKRLTVKQALAHPWLQDESTKKILSSMPGPGKKESPQELNSPAGKKRKAEEPNAEFQVPASSPNKSGTASPAKKPKKVN